MPSLGIWYSPFFLETKSVKEAPGPGAIPGPATKVMHIDIFSNPRYSAKTIL